jgi:hypothetical protein
MFYFKTCCSFGSPWHRPWQEHLEHFPCNFPLKKNILYPLYSGLNHNKGQLLTDNHSTQYLTIDPLSGCESIRTMTTFFSHEMWRPRQPSTYWTPTHLTHSPYTHKPQLCLTPKRGPPIMFWCTGLGLHVSVKHVYRRCHSVAELNRKGECGRWSLYTMWGAWGRGGYVAMRQVGRVGGGRGVSLVWREGWRDERQSNSSFT